MCEKPILNDKKMISEFCETLAGIKMLSVEHGQVISEMLSRAMQAPDGLISYTTKTWRESMGAKLGYQTDKAVIRLLKEIEEKRIVFKYDQHSYLLNPKIFGYEPWRNVENYSISIRLDKSGEKRIYINTVRVEGCPYKED